MQTIASAVQQKAEKAKMTDWNTLYVPVGFVPGKEKTRRQTPRQSRASALVAKAKAHAVRLIAQGK